MKNYYSTGNVVLIKNIENVGGGRVDRKRFAGKPTAIGMLAGVPMQDAEVGEEFNLQLVGVIEEEVTFTGEEFVGAQIGLTDGTDALSTVGDIQLGKLLDHVPAAGTYKVRIRLQTL